MGSALVLVAGLGFAEDKAPSLKVPEQVRYVRASPERNAEARSLVLRAFSKDGEGFDTPGLFGEFVICGPFLWDAIKDLPELGEPPESTATFVMRDKGGKPEVVVRGMHFRGEEIQRLRAALRAYRKADAASALSVPSEKELGLYWALIPWDIEEPLLVVESPSHRWFLHFQGMEQLFYLDDFHRLRSREK